MILMVAHIVTKGIAKQLQIIKLEESLQSLQSLPSLPSRLVVHHANLDTILSQIPPAYKLSIISIVGAFRTGKSFFLNFLLAFLYNTYGDSRPNDGIVDGGNTPVRDGFHYKHGRNPHTMGVWMWGTPFLSHKHKTAILIMDTQGLFDLNTNQNRTVQLFGISSLVSSMLIFNTDKKIQEDHLQQIALFTEYGRMASLVTKNRAKPFHDLMFLIRDWQHFNDEYGNATTSTHAAMHQQYMREVMLDKLNTEQQSTRNHIMDSYTSINCFCLPHPGPTVANGTFTGNLDELDPFFLQKINNFMITMMQSLKAKTLMSRPMTAIDLKQSLVQYTNIFQNNSLPPPRTILNATIAIQHQTIMTQLITEFRNTTDDVIHQRTIKTWDSFVTYMNRSIQQCLVEFSRSVTIGSPDVIQSSKSQLHHQLHDLAKTYCHHFKVQNITLLSKIKPIMVLLFSLFACRSITGCMFIIVGNDDKTQPIITSVIRFMYRLLSGSIFSLVGVLLYEIAKSFQDWMPRFDFVDSMMMSVSTASRAIPAMPPAMPSAMPPATINEQFKPYLSLSI